MMAGDALPQELVEDAENLAEGTKIFSLNVTTTGDAEIAKEVFKVLCQAALDVAHMSVSTTVSSYINEPSNEDELVEYGITHNENTLFKVLDALVVPIGGYPPLNKSHAQELIREMMNAGILFREPGGVINVKTAIESMIDYAESYKVPSAVLEGPHSKACGIHIHIHGPACHPNCPTCGGK